MKSAPGADGRKAYYMTLQEVLLRADEMRPNALTPQLKTGFINDAEGHVLSEIYLKTGSVPVYEYPKDADTALFLKAPHDRVYVYYLCAMIDFAQKDYAEYRNDLEIYNAALSELTHFVAWDLRPADEREN